MSNKTLLLIAVLLGVAALNSEGATPAKKLGTCEIAFKLEVSIYTNVYGSPNLQVRSLPDGIELFAVVKGVTQAQFAIVPVSLTPSAPKGYTIEAQGQCVDNGRAYNMFTMLRSAEKV